MGTDYYPMTLIGLKVPKEKIIVEGEELRNNCKCEPKTDPSDYPEAKFCSKCGNKTRRAVKVDKPLFDGFRDYYNEDQKICGYSVEHDTDARNFFICLYTTGHVDWVNMSEIPNISEEAISKFEVDMESVGLWDKEQFGLWTILYCSY